MTNLSQLHFKINEWERMSMQNERWVNRNSAAPPTPSQHVISMQQEIVRLKEALGEAAYELKSAHNYFKEENKTLSLTHCS